MSNEEHIEGDKHWDGVPMPQRIYAVIAILCGIFVSVVGSTLANVALPHIAHDFSASGSSVIWVVNAYQLTMVMLLLPFGALGELLNYRKVYLVGLFIFILSSLFCALAPAFWALVLARMAQGVGAACMMSVNTSLVRMVYPKRSLAFGLGFNAAVAAVSSVMGPLLAGVILIFTSWHWIFAFNVPFGILAFMMGRKFLPENPLHFTDRQIDWTGSVLSVLTFGLIVFGVEGAFHGWNRVLVTFLCILFLVSAVIFVRQQRQQPYPVLPFDLFKVPVFSLALLTSVFAYIAQMSALVCLPFFLHDVRAYSDADTSLILTSWPVIIMVVAPLAGILVKRVHSGLLGALGLSIMAVGLFLLASVPEDVSKFNICVRIAICGGGFGIFQSPNNAAILSAAPQQRSGAASSVLSAVRVVGQALGASLVAGLFLRFPANGTLVLYWTSGVFAVMGACFSCILLTMKSPQCG